jgi:hypothetical protein
MNLEKFKQVKKDYETFWKIYQKVINKIQEKEGTEYVITIEDLVVEDITNRQPCAGQSLELVIKVRYYVHSPEFGTLFCTEGTILIGGYNAI